MKKLPKAQIPLKLAELLKSGSPDDIASRVQEKYFNGPMNLIFARLLWVEEQRTVYVGNV